MDTGQIPITIYLDLSKAFDTLNHTILLKKMNHYGIRNSAFRLIENYLSNRKQFVKFGNTQSDLLPSSIGIPQGSILGPLFFSIYINDIPTSSNKLKFLLYADDTTLYSNLGHFDINNIEKDINIELIKVNNWLSANMLTINTRKSKFMLYHKLKKTPIINLQLSQEPIEQVSHFNYLGIVFDDHLSWDNHIDMISIKISKIIGIINRLKLIYPQRILFTLYNSLLVSQFYYGILLWGKGAERIVRLQKRAIRTISFSRPIEHTEPLFKALSLLKLEDLYTLKMYKFYFNLCNNYLPAYFDEYKLLIEPITMRYERRRPILETYKVENEYAKMCLKYQLINLLNTASEHSLEDSTFYITMNSNIYSKTYMHFSKFIKENMISSYNDHCAIEKCYVCGQ